MNISCLFTFNYEYQLFVYISMMNFSYFFFFLRHFRIHIIPLEIKLVNHSVIVIQQGLKMAYIRGQNMGTKTNGQRALTFYNITQGPQGGLIYMNDAPASILGQVNVDNEEVVYMQSDMSLANDSFTATISNQDAQLRDVQFVVKVKPLVRQKSTFKVTESKTQLGQMHLDASRLEIFHIVHIFPTWPF